MNALLSIVERIVDKSILKIQMKKKRNVNGRERKESEKKCKRRRRRRKKTRNQTFQSFDVLLLLQLSRGGAIGKRDIQCQSHHCQQGKRHHRR